MSLCLSSSSNRRSRHPSLNLRKDSEFMRITVFFLDEKPQQEIQEIIPTDTKAATTSPPAHFSCLIKIAYMPNINRPIWNKNFVHNSALARRQCP
ncbi:hypothetical protein YC2023_032979 [Brassica napus]